ncbi:hypothetical protein [Atlantibacter sp.]|uniref:T6SS immunity protein Tli3 family protein n=1 Tax=Atlantibacter sp. TaxID=1903473 RepID=UPI0028A63624|nr:hypothetical protein [Atlantibacter sp.]
MKRTALTAVLLTAVVPQAVAAQEPPTQVVYRFDDHRYLELKGWECEGELWFTDTRRGIHSQSDSQFYRIFTRKFIHPSEKYIALPGWGAGGFSVSKDYGKTWKLATFSPGPNEPDGSNRAPYDDIIAFTVVNDQGFLQTRHSLYMSSKPFEDPRTLPGGPGIKYSIGNGEFETLEPSNAGWAWGMVYMTRRGLAQSTSQFKTNWQDLPDKVPEVKNYPGWDHMQCDFDAGKKK